MRKLMLAAAGAAALAFGGAANAAVVINFDNPTGNLGTSHTYSNGGLSVTAYGVDDNLNPLDLYGKANGGDENGLGIANDPSGDNEIWGAVIDGVGGAVVLNVSNLLANDVTAAQFFMGSTTGGEAWDVWVSNSLGGFTKVLTGTNETWNSLPNWGSYNYYAFTADGRDQNVLLGGLSVTGGVPEPSTWAMMLLGFGAVGFALRRRKRPAMLAQIA